MSPVHTWRIDPMPWGPAGPGAPAGPGRPVGSWPSAKSHANRDPSLTLLDVTAPFLIFGVVTAPSLMCCAPTDLPGRTDAA